MMKPELLNCVKTYNFKTFLSDLVAGIIVGIVALPLAIAFAIASGVSPEKGLFTAIIAGFCISAFGGSRVPQHQLFHFISLKTYIFSCSFNFTVILKYGKDKNTDKKNSPKSSGLFFIIHIIQEN